MKIKEGFWRWLGSEGVEEAVSEISFIEGWMLERDRVVRKTMVTEGCFRWFSEANTHPQKKIICTVLRNLT